MAKDSIDLELALCQLLRRELEAQGVPTPAARRQVVCVAIRHTMRQHLDAWVGTSADEIRDSPNRALLEENLISVVWDAIRAVEVGRDPDLVPDETMDALFGAICDETRSDLSWLFDAQVHEHLRQNKDEPI